MHGEYPEMLVLTNWQGHSIMYSTGCTERVLARVEQFFAGARNDHVGRWIEGETSRRGRRWGIVRRKRRRWGKG